MENPMDEKEEYRRARVVQLAAESNTRQELEGRYGQVWNTEELRAEFAVTGFMAPYVVVTRSGDGVVGSLEFTHNPRFYFNWRAD